MKLWKQIGLFSAAIAPVAVMAAGVGAGAADDFLETLTLLTEWTTGTLGQVIALSMVIVGVIVGITRQSLMAFVIGIGGGMGLNFAPTIIENVFTAALPIMPVIGM